MTGGVNDGVGCHTRLRNYLLCDRRPLPHIYRWEGGAAKGGAQVGGILLGAPPKTRPLSLFGVQGKAEEGALPFPFSHERERQEGLALPLFLS